MDSRRAPRCSLTALRTFEAVARTGSLASAASELNVSLAAVSFQLREMQERLGVALVERTARGTRTTPEGERFAADLAPAFTAIDRAFEALHARQTRSTVATISTMPVFASRWLLPRLARFQQLHPDVDVRLTVTERLVDLGRNGVDLAIRVGTGPWAGVQGQPLFPQRIAPVARRVLAERHADAIARGAIDELPLIANAARPRLWEYWAQDAGVKFSATGPVQVHDSSEMAYQAVLEGLGIGLVDLALVQQDLAHGELVQIHPHAWASGWTHVLVRPANEPLSPAATQLHEWIMQEAER